MEKNSLATVLLPSFGERFSSQLGESLSWAALCRSSWLLTFCAVTRVVWISLPAGWQWTWRGSPWTLGMLTVSSAWLRSVELLQFKNMGIWLRTDLRDSLFLSLLSPPLSLSLSLSNTHILSLNYQYVLWMYLTLNICTCIQIFPLFQARPPMFTRPSILPPEGRTQLPLRNDVSSQQTSVTPGQPQED